MKPYAATVVAVVCVCVLACHEAAGPSETGPLQFESISAGYWHTCAITLNGAAYCWGYNEYRQVGASLNQTEGVPIRVEGGHRFSNIAAGWLYTCGARVDGLVYCWGGSGTGAAGPVPSGNTCSGLPCARVPQPIGIADHFKQVATGVSTACGLRTDEHIVCWGNGEMAVGALDASRYSVLATTYPGCSVDVDSIGYCWGGNTRGRVGDSTFELRLVPVPVHGGLRFRHIGSSHGTSCGVTTTGSLYCWGDNGAGQLGIGVKDEAAHPVPESVNGAPAFVSLTLNVNNSCGLTADQTLYCWGEGDAGVIGDGTTEDRLTPSIAAGGMKFRSLSLGWSHACGIAVDGFAYCWGNNVHGELGRASSEVPGSRVPIRVSGQTASP